MRAIANRTAICITGVILSGCMQSGPTAEVTTPPSAGSFSRLTSWMPSWGRSSPSEAPAPQTAAVTIPAPAPVTSAELQPLPPASLPNPAPSGGLGIGRMREPTGFATASTAPRPAAGRPGAARLRALDASFSVPAKVNCATEAQPGQRVRMECSAAD